MKTQTDIWLIQSANTSESSVLELSILPGAYRLFVNLLSKPAKKEGVGYLR
jgi:hypothetical protein